MRYKKDQIKRIKYYESIFDELKINVKQMETALEAFENIRPKIKELESYYESDLWKKDYADDEANDLPKDLKRGILSEDGIYDLLEEIDRLKTDMKGF